MPGTAGEELNESMRGRPGPCSAPSLGTTGWKTEGNLRRAIVTSYLKGKAKAKMKAETNNAN